MGERYWISGVQLGIFQARLHQLTEGGKGYMGAIESLDRLIREIMDEQFIGRIDEGETKEVRIVEVI